MTAPAPVKTLVMDGDGHVMEPPDPWGDRMDHARWGDRIPHPTVEDGIYETTHPEYHPGILDDPRERIEPLDQPGRDGILGRKAIDAYGLPR